MRTKQAYSLFPRKVGKNKKTIWYYMAYDEDGVRHQYSTGCTSRTQALDEMNRRVRQDQLIRDGFKAAVPTFAEFADKWWTEDCPYLKSEKDHGRELSPGYVAIQKKNLDRYLIPAFGKKRIDALKVVTIEKWQHLLLDGTAPVSIPEKAVGVSSKNKKLSPKSVNNLTSLLSTMLREAVRLGHMEKNPCSDLKGFSDRSKRRGVITTDEAKQIFSSKAWKSDIARVASLLSAVTGMRSGEILAVRYEDVKADHIHVEHSWDPKHGIKGTKTGDVRDLPIPDKVMDALMKIRAHRKDGQFIFSVLGDTPVSRGYLLNNLRNVMDAEKVDWKTRNIGFHSWRHFLNTQLLGAGLSGEITREITGHTTEEMTQRYKHFELEHFKGVLEVTGTFME